MRIFVYNKTTDMKVTYIKIKDILTDVELTEMIISCLEFMTEEEFDTIVFHNLTDEVEIAFMFNSDHTTNQFIQVLKDNNVFISSQDITSLILMCDLDDHKLFNEVFSDANIDEHAIPLLKKFIAENTSVNMILDKISAKGIESLTDMDKKILENN